VTVCGLTQSGVEMDIQLIDKKPVRRSGSPVQAFEEGRLREHLGLTEEDLDLALDLGNAKMKIGDMVAAFRIYSTLVLCDPGNFRYQQGLANLCLKIGEFEVTIQAASSMIALKPDNALGYYFSGAACLAIGHHSEAREDIGDALVFAERNNETLLLAECRKILQQIELLQTGVS